MDKGLSYCGESVKLQYISNAVKVCNQVTRGIRINQDLVKTRMEEFGLSMSLACMWTVVHKTSEIGTMRISIRQFPLRGYYFPLKLNFGSTQWEGFVVVVYSKYSEN